jgi:putative ABC transport system permease protein
MLPNYLKITLRRLWKKRGFSLLNITGLAIGISAFFLLLQYVRFERSYDRFHEHAEDIYRVGLEQYHSGELMFESAENYPALGPAMKKDFPEVLEYARLYNLGAKNNMVLTYEGAPSGPVKFKHRRLLYADPSFLPMFSYEMIAGDAPTALAEPFKMVISESYAKKYFGDADPLGKVLRLQDDDFNDERCEVTGVVQDPPNNTHLKFDVLVSYNTLFARGDWAPARYDQSWQRKDMYTYIRTRAGTDPAALEAKLPGLVDKYLPDLETRNRKDVLYLQPLTSIHLYSHLSDEPEANGDGRSVYALMIIAFFILVIAYVNYINLATSRSMERANEVGIRKVAGAYRGQLIRQFLLESALVNFLALVLAAGIVQLSLPFFNQLAGTGAPPFQIWQHSWVWITFGVLFLVGAFFSGLYPAFVLSSFRPVSVLSGKVSASRFGTLFRKGLVVFQFATCVALIIGTITVFRQLNFMRAQDLGFNPDQVLVVERPGVRIRQQEDREEAINSFKEQLKQNPAIKAVASSLTIPGKKMRWKTSIRKYSDPPEETHAIDFSGGDYDLIETLEIDLLAGRNFSREMGSDPDTAILITATAASMLGFDSPDAAVGQTLTLDDFETSAIVIGVTTDFHQEALRNKPDPMLFSLFENYGEYYLFRVNPTNVVATISSVENAWNTHFPGNPFHYFFLDDLFDAQYRNDQRFGQLFSLFAGLAILVGCLGLLGLSAFAVQRRFKEIGIRKVLGASALQILFLLNKDFLRLILLAILVASPLMGYLMFRWLQGFAYRIDMGWEIFGGAALIVLLIALITTSFQTIKAALVNPVESIRYE